LKPILKKAKKAAKDAKGTMTTAASKMFAFYLNLLSPKSKYTWNKIVVEQMESNPYVNLQGVSLEGPREMSRGSFNNCVVFHLLIMFPINVAEQEKYYITMCQFVRPVCNSMPTLLRCCASTTAPTQMPAPNPRMFCSQRLS
jgi:hypothetical protein